MQDEYKPLGFGMCGIYEIKCLASKRVYVGSSKNVYFRVGQHYYELKANRHTNVELQSDWQAYGESNFVWRILEYCSLSECRKKEFVYIQGYSDGVLYNVNLAKDGNDRRFQNEIPKREPRLPTPPLGIGAFDWQLVLAWIPSQIERGEYIDRLRLCQLCEVEESTVANRNWLGIIYKNYRDENGESPFVWEIDPIRTGKRGRKITRLRPK